MNTSIQNQKLKLIAIGALGNMLAPSARHLNNSAIASFTRILDRGTSGHQKEQRRHDWKIHGAKLCHSMKDLVGEGDFDGIVICAGKNGDDFAIMIALMALLKNFKPKQPYFILHLSTVSTHFVKATKRYFETHGIDYVNYPLTGGKKGADSAKMLILASGNKNLYQRLESMLQQIGVPSYFGEEITLGAATKLISHILVFHGLLGISLATVLHKQVMKYPQLNESQTELFDFLNSGAGGTHQWNVAVKLGIANQLWHEGFLIKHAIVDIFYVIELMLDKKLPETLIMGLIEIALLFTYILKENQNVDLATQAIAQLISDTDSHKIDEFIKKNLTLNMRENINQCIQELPEKIRQSLMLEIESCYQ